MSDCIDVCKYTASFYVETAHEDQLEYVLSAAGERNQRNYPHLLWSQMDANLKHAHIEGGSITDLSTYGTLMFTLEVCRISELQKALTICAETVKSWVWRYRIGEMHMPSGVAA